VYNEERERSTTLSLTCMGVEIHSLLFEDVVGCCCRAGGSRHKHRSGKMQTVKYNPYSVPGWVSTEAPVFPESRLIGMSIEAFEQKFEVYCDHIHNSPILRETRSVPAGDVKIEYGMTLAVFGTLAALDAVVTAAIPTEAPDKKVS